MRYVPTTKSNPPAEGRVHVVIDGSPQKDKKLRAVFTFPDGRKKTTHFGAKHYNDYTIHNDKRRRTDYLARHGKREDWDDFTTAGALSKWILWNKPTVKKSFDHFLAIFSLTGDLKVKTSQAGKIEHFNKKYDNPPFPKMYLPKDSLFGTKENPISPLQSGIAIKPQKDDLGRKVFYMPEWIHEGYPKDNTYKI